MRRSTALCCFCAFSCVYSPGGTEACCTSDAAENRTQCLALSRAGCSGDTGDKAGGHFTYALNPVGTVLAMCFTLSLFC